MKTSTKLALVAIGLVLYYQVKRSVDKEFGSGKVERIILPPESESMADRLKALADANNKK